MFKPLFKHWPLLLVIFLGIVLRLLKIEEFFYFTYDESVPAFVGRRLILWHHFPFIGGVTPFGVHVTPYFYWLLTILLFIGRLDPIVWGVAGAIFSAATMFGIYILGKNFESKKLGITAAIFWAFSYLANIYDRHLWALYWGPMLSLVIIFSLYKLIKGKENYVFLLAFATIWGITADTSNLIFIPYIMLIWFLYKLPLSKKTAIAIIIFLLSFLPLAIFDLRHNFVNSKPFFTFWKKGQNNPGFQSSKFIENSLLFPRAFTRLTYTFGDNQISKQYSYCREYIQEKFQAIPNTLLFASALLLLAFTFWSLQKKNQQSWRLVGILVIVYFFGIQLYGTIFKADIFEHYITGLFAVFVLIIAKIISLLPKRLFLIAILLFAFLNLHKLFNARDGLGLSYKKEAIFFTMNSVGEQPFSLESLSTCWRYSGYRYLFAVYGREPVKSYVDPNFSYLYGTTPVWDHHPKTVVAFVIHDFAPETGAYYQKYAIYKSHEVKSGLFGNIEVIIMDNSAGWFDNQNRN